MFLGQRRPGKKSIFQKYATLENSLHNFYSDMWTWFIRTLHAFSTVRTVQGSYSSDVITVIHNNNKIENHACKQQGSHTSGAKKFQTFSRLFPNSNKKFPYHSPTVLRSTIPCPCYCFITVIHVYMYLRQINGLVFLATCLYVKWVGRCKIKGHNFQSMRGWYNHFNCSDGRSAVFFT